MAISYHHLMYGFRRFVALRSAWRRSLALEPWQLPPGAPTRQGEATPKPDDDPAGRGGCEACSCHA